MLQASDICKRYGDLAVLDRVTFTINPGDRIGLVGPNGSGKTTLLRILTGHERPDRGSVKMDPSNLVVGYLEQGLTYSAEDTLDDVLRQEQRDLAEAEIQVAEFAEALSSATGERQRRLLDAYAEALTRLERLALRQTPEHEVEQVLSGLDLAHLPLSTPVGHLSGGQKTRLGLARLLIRKPQILLLDEPTNHLDIEALEWLECWLSQYDGAALIVSHDRTFLDRTVNWIYELDERTHRLTAYPGNYTEYLQARRRETERHWEAYTAQQERIAQLTGEARRLSNYAGSIERGTIDFSIRKIAKGIARRAVVQRRRIERELEAEKVEKPRLSWHMKLEFVDTPESGQEVLRFENLAIGYDGDSLVRDINEILVQGERVALLGANGTGKTTLLRTITGEIAPLAGKITIGSNVKIGYYAQEQENLDPTSTPFATIRQAAAMSDTEVRSFLHYFLFAGDDVFVPIRSLSYGERARLVLARLVASGCNCLLLDEPINHLDIPSRASFEQAMTAFEGTVLAVVHDRYFIREFATHVWAIEGGFIRNYVDLEDYQRRRDRQLEP
ncbi:MAG: ribosomal protection-like ABC-F family protein [Anaerolineae bacterium]